MNKTSHNLIINSADNINNNGSSNTITIKLPSAYNSKSNDQIALANLNIYYSWFNLTTAFNNTYCSYTWTDGVNYAVNFPPGFYQVSDLSAYIQLVMKTNGHYLVDSNGNIVYYLSLVVNPVYYSVTLTCSAIPNGSLPTGYTNPASVTLNGKVPLLVTSTNNFGKLIGYANSTFFPATLSTVPAQFNSTLTPQVSPVTNVYVTCNWINNSSFSKYTNVIQNFTSTGTTFGSLISFYPTYILFYDIATKSYQDISISFYDQNFTPLQLNDTNQITASFIIQTTK